MLRRSFLRWMLVALLFFMVSGFAGFTVVQREGAAHRALAEQACRLVGEDRRAMYRILISLAYLDSVPAKTQQELRREASDVFRTLDCSEVDKNLLDIPPIELPR